MDLAGVEVEQLRAAAREGVLLKDSPLRRVWRTRLGDRSVVLKESRIRGSAERVRAIWLRSRARKEAAMLREARRRGLPCPEALAAVVERGLSPRSGWLVLEDLGSGRDVASILRDELGARTRSDDARGLLATCGEEIARAHAAGLRHHDLHLGNLWRGDDGRIFLLDLHSAHFASAHGAAPRVAELSGLLLSLPWPEDAALREALLAPICAGASMRLAELEAALPRLLARHLRRRGARALRPSGSFVRLRGEGARAAAGPHSWGLARRGGRDAEPWSRARLLDAIARGRALKSGRRGRVVVCNIAGEAVVAKSRREASSLCAWRAAEALAQRRLPHARALATCDAAADEAAAAPARWVVHEHVDGCSLADAATAKAPRRVARSLARDFGRILGRMHGSGLRCRDTKLDNFVVRDGSLVLVDLDGVAPMRPFVRTATIAADLGRALAWLRAQAPAHLRARADELARVALCAWRREWRSFMIARPRETWSAAAVDRIARGAQDRGEAWRKKHKTTSDREAAGSASGGAA